MNEQAMELSAIICTYNRSGHLHNALNSLAEQATPSDFAWEIIVVDNNSTDDTQQVAESFAVRSIVPVRYIMETKQGLSHARNRGIAEARGRNLAFIDDDALVEKGWASAICEAFTSYYCDCVGGRIYLKPVKDMPSWLSKDLWGFLACLDYGDEPFRVADHYIYGTNMAFRRGIFDQVGCFNPELGRTGYLPVGGEETDLVDRIKAAGGTVCYQPSAVVHHVTEEYKLKKNYFRTLHYYEGLYKGKVWGGELHRHLFGIPLFIFGQFARSVARCIAGPTVRKQMNVWWYLGFMKGRVLVHKK